MNTASTLVAMSPSKSKNGHALRATDQNGTSRLNLIGTAILERDNKPVLTTSYQFWTDQANSFFGQDVQEFERIELKTVAFSVNGSYERTPNKILEEEKAKATEVHHANSKSGGASMRTDYLWGTNTSSLSDYRRWISLCNNFVFGFFSCLTLVVAYLFLLS